MIYYLCRAKHQYTIFRHLTSFGARLREIIQPLSYEKLFRQRRLTRGVYIFADIERLWPNDAELAAKFWRVMQQDGGFQILNHPTRSMRRYELLRTMFLRGSNRFNVYRLAEHRLPEKFPVYLRGENDHDGNATPLLHNAAELAAAISQMDQAGRSRENLLITEFCDVADSGRLYHKCSAFCVGGVIIPRHLCFSKRWMVKQPIVADPDRLEQERAYLTANPHESELREIFATAQIDYGRIDYAVLDGVIQVWEINTNPMICTSDIACGATRTWIQEEFAGTFCAALAKLNTSCKQTGSIHVNPRDPTRIRKPKTLLQRFKQLLRLNQPR